MIDVNSLINKIPESERAAFKAKVTSIASSLGVPYNHLMAIMDLESAGSFNPAIKNSLGYVGLIQFGSAAAKDLGTTTADLQKMTRIRQLDYVKAYFDLWKKRLGISSFKDFVDLYLVVLYPNAVKQSNPDFPFMTPAQEAANPGLKGPDGHITKNSIKAVYAKRYQGLFEYVTEVAKKHAGMIALVFFCSL